jgi:flagellar motor component MotA
MRAISLVVMTFGVFCAGAMLEGASFSSFFQPSAMLMVFGPLAVYLVTTLGMNGSFQFARRAFNSQVTVDDNQVFDRMGNLGFLFGGICVLVGFVHVFQNLADGTKIGAGIAVAMVGCFYGAIPAIFGTLLSSSSSSGVNNQKGRTYMAAAAAVALFLLGTGIFVLTKVHTT